MFKFLLGLAALVFGWELGLAKPDYLFFSLLVTALASVYLSLWLSPQVSSLSGRSVFAGWRFFWLDRILLLAFNLSFFWLILCGDFQFFKYLPPIFIAVLLFYFFSWLRRDSETSTLPVQMSLIFFLGGIFFTAAVTIGLVVVLGWPMWGGMLIFMGVLALLAAPANNYLYAEKSKVPLGDKLKTYLILLLAGAEFFSTIIWLPFGELTLALILTLLLIFVYDFLKYYLAPELVRPRIILKKIVVYSIFLLFLLASTPWF